MFGKRAVVALFLGLVVFGYLSWLNPDPVKFQILPAPDTAAGDAEGEAADQGRPPSADAEDDAASAEGGTSSRKTPRFSKVNASLLLLIFFLAGIALGTFMAAFREAMRSFTFWRRGRRNRRREKAGHLLAQGRRQAVSGRMKTARRLMQKAYRKASGESLMALEVARVEIADGQFQSAEGRLKGLLASEPRNPEVLALLLDLYRARRDFAGQLATLSRWLDADPNHMPTLRALRDLYRQSANWPEAVRVQEKILEQTEGRTGRNAELRVLTELRYRQAVGLRPVRSRSLLERIVQQDEAFAPAHLALGEALLAAGDGEAAVQAWIRGYHATGQMGLLLRAEEARVKEGRTDEMLKLYSKLSKKGGAPVLLRARLLLSLERSQEALKALEDETADGSTGRLGRALLGETLFRLHSYDGAARALRESVFGPGGDLPLTFTCRSCGNRTGRWAPTCPSCEACDTLHLDTEAAAPPSLVPALS